MLQLSGWYLVLCHLEDKGKQILPAKLSSHVAASKLTTSCLAYVLPQSFFNIFKCMMKVKIPKLLWLLSRACFTRVNPMTSRNSRAVYTRIPFVLNLPKICSYSRTEDDLQRFILNFVLITLEFNMKMSIHKSKTVPISK